MGAFSLGGSVDTGRLLSFGGLGVSNPASLVRRFVQVLRLDRTTSGGPCYDRFPILCRLFTKTMERISQVKSAC